MILSQSRPINRLAGDFGDILREMSDVYTAEVRSLNV